MLGPRELFFIGLALLWTGYMFALATGRTHLDLVRDERDARLSRWLFGGFTGIVAVVLAVVVENAYARVAFGALAAAGAAVILTASRHASRDTRDRIDAAELRAVAERLGASRTSASAPVEVHPLRRWTVFVAVVTPAIAAGFVLAAMSVLENEHLGLWGRVGFIAFFLLFGAVLTVLGTAWVVRALTRTPFLRLDDRGLVAGHDRARHASIDWEEIAEIEVRTVVSKGMTYRILAVTPRNRETWFARQPRTRRLMAWVSSGLYGAPIAYVDSGMNIRADEIAAHIARFRPDLIGFPRG